MIFPGRESTAGGKIIERRWVPMSTDPGLSDLTVLLRSMRPELDEQPFVFYSLARSAEAELDFRPLCRFEEGEGVSVIVTQSQAAERGWPADSVWARITLTVHSSLQAVGFLAAVAGALAREGISVNPVSAFHHDHLFVPWERRGRVMDILSRLSRSQTDGSATLY
jgi:hypothetical protein